MEVAAPRPGAAEEPSAAGAPDSSIDGIDKLLDEVERALSRLDDGTYGRCAACGAPIGDARLAEEPTALHCRDCSEVENGTSPTGPVAAPHGPVGSSVPQGS